MSSLYFHIPFCTRKCPYCHFYVIPNREDHQKVLLDALFLEWNLYKEQLKDTSIASIYFGGGTPSLFASHIPEILQWISEIPSEPSCEITVETNPEDVTDKLIANLLSSGVNRISLGVQSLEDRSLQILQRTHNAQKALDSIAIFERQGLKNFSIDLMFDLPNQTLQSLSHTFEQIKPLNIPHLSLYNLTIEKHTAFYKKRASLKKKMPSSKKSLELLAFATDQLEQMGLERYEISAFAKPGFASKHNLGYWSSRPYLGLGPSACSYWGKKRWKNTAHLQKYYKALLEKKRPIEFEESLPKLAQIAEHFILHLRKIQGVDLFSFYKLFGKLPKELQVDIDRLIKEGYLCKDTSSCKLTEKGLLFYDSIAEELVQLPAM